jgi:hypothetical protein
MIVICNNLCFSDHYKTTTPAIIPKTYKTKQKLVKPTTTTTLCQQCIIIVFSCYKQKPTDAITDSGQERKLCDTILLFTVNNNNNKQTNMLYNNPPILPPCVYVYILLQLL